MKKHFLIIAFFASLTVTAQFNPKQIEEKLSLPKKDKLNETVIQIGRSFLGVPYVGGTLEGPEEKLVCRLDAFDCYTFVENVIAISLAKHSKTPTYNEYTSNLKKLRYRNGIIDGYISRIHYFSDWANNAVKNKYLQDLSPILGEKVNKKIDFMGKHRSLYPAFATDNNIYAQVLEMEKKQPEFYQIPKDKFSTYESAIKDGDIIAFTSTIAGLDVNHEGIALWKNGKLHFMHASLEKKKVIISEETLNDYLMRIKKDAGVMVLRVL